MSPDLESAESLTKHLRRKGEKPETLLKVGRSLFCGEITVYLPRKNLVLIDWLLDKLQDERTWRANPIAWKLLHDVWEATAEDLTARSYGNHKFSLILSGTLKEMIMTSAAQNEATMIKSLCSEVANTIRIINKGVQNVLADVLVAAKWLHDNLRECFDSSEFLGLVRIISEKTSIRTSVHLDVCIPLLGIEDIPSDIYDVLKGVVLVNKDTAVAQISSSKSSKSSGNYQQPENLSRTLGRIFTILLEDKQTKKVYGKSILESFLAVAISAESNNSIANLLELAIVNQVPTNNETLKKIITSNNCDDRILKAIVQLSPELVIGNDTSVKIFQRTSVDRELALHVTKAFIISRRLDDFFSEWTLVLRTKKEEVWLDQEVQQTILTALAKSTPFQLYQLLETFKDDTAVLSLIVKSLAKVTADTALLDNILPEIASKTDDWPLKYDILTLNARIVEKCHSSIIKSVEKISHKISDKMPAEKIYCLFRIKELGYDIPVWDQVVAYTEQHVDQLLPEIVARWFVLLNHEFPEKCQEAVAKKLVSSDGSSLLDVLIDNPVFYEQTHLVSSVLQHLVYQQQRPLDTWSCRLLQKFPATVFSKAMKARMLDQLVEMPLSPENVDLVLHLIRMHQGSCKLVIDPKVFIRFVRSMIQAGYPAANEVIELTNSILDRHLDLATHPASALFLQKLVIEATKSLKKAENVNDIKLAAVIAKLDDELAESLVAAIKKRGGGLEVSVLPYLADIPSEHLALLKPDIAELCLGDEFGTCFPSLCKVSKGRENILSLIAVYVERSGSSDTEVTAVDQTFIDAIKDLDSESLLDILSQVVLGALTTRKPQFFAVIWAFVINLNRGENDSIRPLLIKLLCQVTEKVSSGDLADTQVLKWVCLIQETLLREKSWIVNQFMLENMLVFISETAKLAFEDEQLYNSCCQIMSAILLFHRHRLNGRYHLVMLSFDKLLNWVFLLSNGRSNTSSSASISSVQAYSRLVTNLCEPSVRAIREKGGKNQLTSLSAIAKRQLSKFLPTLLLSYISACLRIGLAADFREELKPGVYAIIEVLGTEGLRTASSLMDYSSRAYLRPLYDDYRLHGKWQAADA